MNAATGRVDTSPLEAAAVVALCFGWGIYASTAMVLRGFPSGPSFTDAGAVGLALFEAVFAALAIVLLRLRRYDVRSLVPRVTWLGSVLGVGLTVAVWMVALLVALPFGAAVQSEQPISQMVATSTITAPFLLVMAVVNGTFEEVFLLGFLQRGLRGHGTSISLGVALLVRVSYHLYQGPLGAVSVLGFGIVLGLFHARTQRLWPAVLAHIICDIVPFLV